LAAKRRERSHRGRDRTGLLDTGRLIVSAVKASPRWSAAHPVTAIATVVLIVVYFAVAPWMIEAGAVSARAIDAGEWWRLVTAMFLHGGLLHLLSNIVGLLIIGSPAESRFGGRKYAVILLVGGVGGDVAAWLLPSSIPGAFTLGASGAVMAAAGALLVMLIRRQERVENVILAFGITVATVLQGFADPGVSVAGHLGGLATGAALGYGLGPRRGWTAPVREPRAVAAPGTSQPSTTMRERVCTRLHESAKASDGKLAKPGKRFGGWAPIWMILGGGAATAFGLGIAAQAPHAFDSLHRYSTAGACTEPVLSDCYQVVARTVDQVRLVGSRSKHWEIVFDDGRSPYSVTIPHPITAFYSLCCHARVLTRVWDGQVAGVEIPGQGFMITSDDPSYSMNTGVVLAIALLSTGGLVLILGIRAGLRTGYWLRKPGGFSALNTRFIYSRPGVPFVMGSSAAVAMVMTQVFSLDWTVTWIVGFAFAIVGGWVWYLGHDFDAEVEHLGLQGGIH